MDKGMIDTKIPQCEHIIIIHGELICGRGNHPCRVQQRYYETCDIRKLIEPDDPITRTRPCPDCGGTTWKTHEWRKV